LKTDGGKGFLYAPNIGSPNVEDAVYKVLGKDCASQCQWCLITSDGFELQAFLPKIDANPVKISNVGQYLSIDSRPVNTTRGTSKQIVTLFKFKLRASDDRFDGVKGPFLCLNIKCPIASYDPNVEPAKDDVLFDDSSRVIAAVNELLSAMYPVREKEQIEWTSAAQSSQGVGVVEIPQTVAQQQYLSDEEGHRQPISRESHSAEFDKDFDSEDDEILFLELRAKTAAALKENMYGFDEEDLQLLTENDIRSSRMGSEHPSEITHDITVSNPWTTAKMNAPVRLSIYGKSVLSTAGASQVPVLTNMPALESNQLITTTAPSLPDTYSAHDQHMGPRIEHDLDLSEPMMTPVRIQPPQFNAPRYNEGTSLADNLSSPLPCRLHPEHPFFAHYGLLTPQPSSSSPAYVSSFGAPLNEICEVPRRKGQSRAITNTNPFHSSKSLRQQSKAPKRMIGQGCDIRDLITGRTVRSAALVSPGEPDEDINQHCVSSQIIYPRPDNVDLDSTLTRIRSRRREIDTGPSEVSDTESINSFTPVCHQVVRAKSSGRLIEEARPLKRRRTTESRRTKSSHLLLERVPDNDQMQDLVLQHRTSLKSICSSISKLDATSNFVSWYNMAVDAYDSLSISPDTEEVKQWARRITHGMQLNCEIEDGGVTSVEMVEDRVVAALLIVKWPSSEG
jgi:hypothetical protein